MACIEDTSCTVRDLRRFDGHGNVSIVQNTEQSVTHEKHNADTQSDGSSSNRRNSTSNCSVRGIPMEARDLRFSASLQLGHVLEKEAPFNYSSPYSRNNQMASPQMLGNGNYGTDPHSPCRGQRRGCKVLPLKMKPPAPVTMNKHPSP